MDGVVRSFRLNRDARLAVYRGASFAGQDATELVGDSS